ncbi:MAG TPA: hypothetical protein VI168_10975, partial [Croceibacterium sp.]
MRKLALLAAVAACGIVSAPGTAQETDLTVVQPVPTGYKAKTTSWGEPDLRGGWPIDHLNGRTPLQRDPAQGNRAYLTEEEFAQRDQAVQQLARRYENEDSQGTMGIGHWAEVASANRRTSWITAPANGRRPEYTAEGKRLSGEMRSTWRRGQ